MNPSLILSISMLSTVVVWPDLPKDGFVRGRPATHEDATLGNAAFAMESGGKIIGKPLSIDIPQYAIHVEEGTGKETPVILIQAEEGNGMQVAGYQVVGTSDLGACLLRELRLLGTKKPN